MACRARRFLRWQDSAQARRSDRGASIFCGPDIALSEQRRRRVECRARLLDPSTRSSSPGDRSSRATAASAEIGIRTATDRVGRGVERRPITDCLRICWSDRIGCGYRLRGLDLRVPRDFPPRRSSIATMGNRQLEPQRTITRATTLDPAAMGSHSPAGRRRLATRRLFCTGGRRVCLPCHKPIVVAAAHVPPSRSNGCLVYSTGKARIVSGQQ